MKYSIQHNAMLMLSHIYQNCSPSFTIENLEIGSLNFGKTQKWQSQLYLQKMEYVSKSTFMNKEETHMSGSIEVSGINAVEDYFTAR
jgi:hypothetical protein